MVLWLDEDAASSSSLLERTGGVGTVPAFAELIMAPEVVGMAVAGTLVGGIVVVPGGWG